MGPGGWGGAGLGYAGFGGFGMGPGGWGGFGVGAGGNGPGGNGPGGNGPGGGRGNRGQQDPEMAQRFAAMREAMDQLQQGSEQALAKILDKGQYSRLKQIQLQMEGMPALLQPDMIEKLSLNEDQVAQIQELLNEGRQASRQNQRAYFDMMRTAFPDQGNNGQNGQNGGPGGGGFGGGGQNGGPGGPGGPGGNNGRGRRPPGPNFRDPAVQEAMQTFMEKPETKATIAQIKTQNDKLQNQLVAAVYRALTKRQVTAFKKMLGAPFETAKLTGGLGQGPGGRNGGTNQANSSQAASKSAASASGVGEAATAKPAAKAKSSSTAKRKSLRELRGLDQ
jgi:hypothetical protein